MIKVLSVPLVGVCVLRSISLCCYFWAIDKCNVRHDARTLVELLEITVHTVGVSEPINLIVHIAIGVLIPQVQFFPVGSILRDSIIQTNSRNHSEKYTYKEDEDYRIHKYREKCTVPSVPIRSGSVSMVDI